MVLMVSRKFLGKDTPGILLGVFLNYLKKTHQSCLETYSHHREGFVPSSSVHRHILVRGVLLDVCISRRPPKDTHNYANS